MNFDYTIYANSAPAKPLMKIRAYTPTSALICFQHLTGRDKEQYHAKKA